MSNRHIFSITPDARERLVAMFPGITPANLIRFDDLVTSDRLLADDGKPTKALTEWVLRVLAK